MIMEAIQSTQSSAAPSPDGYVDAPSLLCNGDPGEEMAAMAVENGETERTLAHQERDTEEAAEAQADAAQVKAMHDEASSLRAQGVFDAATAVVGACLAVACPPAASGAPTVQGLVTGHLSDGVEKLGDALWKSAQHDDEARATAAKAVATQHEDAAKDAADAASDANASLGAALDFDRNYTSTESQTQLAALHRA
jgi:hypothetical protein